MHVCVPVCAATDVVRSVKRKGSDQSRDKTMEEARQKQGVVGGTVKAQRPCAHCNFTVLRYFYDDIFLL